MEDRIKILISNRDIIEYCENEKSYYFNNEKYISENNSEFKPISIINEIVNRFASAQYDNTIILAGAGTSITILTPEEINDLDIDTSFNYSGKTMKEISSEIKKYLDLRKDLFSIEDLISLSKYNKRYTDTDFNLEDLLSKLILADSFIETCDKEKYDLTIKEINNLIKQLCDITLCKFHKYTEFINKLTSRRNSHNRIKIFTTNYDTLFEQAALKENFILIDGFSFDTEKLFNNIYFDYDVIIRGDNKITDERLYVDKVFHLYKLHGSIDWTNDVDKIKKISKKNDNALMIFPTSRKYEQSYTKPYFELFSRFQIELRRRNTLLIVIGFSFGDKHITSMIYDAMISNPHLMILIVNIDINENINYLEFIKRAEDYSNVMLFNSSFNNFVDIYKKQRAYSNDLFENSGDN